MWKVTSSGCVSAPRESDARELIRMLAAPSALKEESTDPPDQSPVLASKLAKLFAGHTVATAHVGPTWPKSQSHGVSGSSTQVPCPLQTFAWSPPIPKQTVVDAATWTDTEHVSDTPPPEKVALSTKVWPASAADGV